jgi:photosynthetic reaction center cytochrome c subunit
MLKDYPNLAKQSSGSKELISVAADTQELPAGATGGGGD